MGIGRKNRKKSFEAKKFDIDALASDVLEDCKDAARNILQVVVTQLNESVRKDKDTRKELGLVLKEKNRKREILTELGILMAKPCGIASRDTYRKHMRWKVYKKSMCMQTEEVGLRTG